MPKNTPAKKSNVRELESIPLDGGFLIDIEEAEKDKLPKKRKLLRKKEPDSVYSEADFYSSKLNIPEDKEARQAVESPPAPKETKKPRLKLWFMIFILSVLAGLAVLYYLENTYPVGNLVHDYFRN